ncbi:macro domain-containing protein [Streptomyces olivaceus]|uniref:macro domain-containing protein n=1 Tax=Streptomyces TaxID=1883 RepID=UPI001FB72393|nr:macro domain-containing protein [Streptomyces sp. CB09030]UOG77954.1 hypothetical protein L6J92_01420 [Streptomyces sp. CB09030]
MDALPSHRELTEELKRLRLLGLPRLRHCSRDGLRAAAVAAGFCEDADDELDGIEELLGSAVRRLGGGGELRDADDCDPLARAAAHSFGLFAYRRGVPAPDRRKAAAGVYGVGTERFRKSQEHEVLDGLASAVLSLARSGRTGTPGGIRAGTPGAPRLGVPGAPPPGARGGGHAGTPWDSPPDIPGATRPGVPGGGRPGTPGAVPPAAPGNAGPTAPGRALPAVPGQARPAVPGDSRSGTHGGSRPGQRPTVRTSPVGAPPTAHGLRPPSSPPGAAAPTRPPSPARTSATSAPPATRPPEQAPSESAPPESASPESASPGSAFLESADTDSADTAFPAAAFPGVPGRVTVRVAPIERVWDTDILVSSENVYLEMSKTFRPTVSGVLRRAAAERAAGEVVDDVLARELALWLHTHRSTGLAVPPGTVVPTSAGALSRQGVRRIYHAAVATPVDHGSRYHVAPGTVADAVRASFELGRAERRTLALPLTSICFPLLGAGHGGLPAADAAARLLAAIREELRRDPSWSVLLVTVHREYLEFLRDANSGS